MLRFFIWKTFFEFFFIIFMYIMNELCTICTVCTLYNCTSYKWLKKYPKA